MTSSDSAGPSVPVPSPAVPVSSPTAPVAGRSAPRSDQTAPKRHGRTIAVVGGILLAFFVAAIVVATIIVGDLGLVLLSAAAIVLLGLSFLLPYVPNSIPGVTRLRQLSAFGGMAALMAVLYLYVYRR